MTASLDALADRAARWLDAGSRPLVLGLCGAQGSGKSTLAHGLVAWCGAHGLNAATLSLDDLYLPKAERRRLARDVHPLLATRGVPLTHDVGLGLDTLAAVRAGRPVRLPRFDKASDDPLPRDRWQAIDGPLDLLVFEGWCVGAIPQPEAALAAPVNALERDEDADGRWRHAVNAALAGPYHRLWAALDRLVLLAAPGFEVVRGWRLQQEDELRARLVAERRDPALAMTDAALDRFIRHYERLTRWILDEMPARADCALRLDATRDVTAIGGLSPDTGSPDRA